MSKINTKYSIGAEVQAVSNPSRIGTVVEVGAIHGGIQYYCVNWGGAVGRSTVPEVDLRPFHPAKTPLENLRNGDILRVIQNFNVL